MTEADVILEFRQIMALEQERKTGKPYEQSETMYDEDYTNYVKSLGIPEETLKEHGYG